MSKTYSIGVDLGGTHLRVAAYGGGRGFLDTIVLRTRFQAGRDQLIRDMCGAIEALRGLVLQSIAVWTSGPLVLPAGIFLNPPNFAGWEGFDLRAAITQRLGCEILTSERREFAALAEQRLGAGSTSGVADLCDITLGTGVGNGLVPKEKVWDAVNGMAGEAGTWS